MGLPPEEFWEQTPATFNAIITGRQQAANDAHEAALFEAYHAAAFGRVEKLKPLSHYLKAMQPKKQKISLGEFISRFEAMAASGYDVKVH